MKPNFVSGALLSTRLLREACWVGQGEGRDSYPATLEHRIELEGLLAFIQAHDRLDSFWPRLTIARKQERDDALQELRVARFFTSHGFPIAQWEPPGDGNTIGEFSVKALPSASIFIEIKSPGWEGELTDEQRAAGRAKEEKYQHLEGGAVGPAQKIRMSVRKAYPKFLNSQPSLLVIADDLRVPLADWSYGPAEQALFTRSTSLDGEPGYFTGPEFHNLGGVALFKAELPLGGELRYEFALYPNPMALTATALPKIFVDAFGG